MEGGNSNGQQITTYRLSAPRQTIRNTRSQGGCSRSAPELPHFDVYLRDFLAGHHSTDFCLEPIHDFPLMPRCKDYKQRPRKELIERGHYTIPRRVNVTDENGHTHRDLKVIQPPLERLETNNYRRLRANIRRQATSKLARNWVLTTFPDVDRLGDPVCKPFSMLDFDAHVPADASEQEMLAIVQTMTDQVRETMRVLDNLGVDYLLLQSPGNLWNELHIQGIYLLVKHPLTPITRLRQLWARWKKAYGIIPATGKSSASDHTVPQRPYLAQTVNSAGMNSSRSRQPVGRSGWVLPV